MSTDHPHEAPLVRDLTNRETRIRLVDKHLAHHTPEEREKAISELDEDAAEGTLPVLSEEQWDELEHGDPVPREERRHLIRKESGKDPLQTPVRRGDPRRKVRWVRSRDGRSKYTPHAGAKELAKAVIPQPNDNETTI